MGILEAGAVRRRGNRLAACESAVLTDGADDATAWITLGAPIVTPASPGGDAAAEEVAKRAQENP